MMPAFSTSCSKLIEKWKKMVSPQGSHELDVWPDIQTFSSDVILRTAFGSNYEEGKRIFELQKEQAVLVLEAFKSVYIPGFRYILNSLGIMATSFPQAQMLAHTSSHTC
ncbi:hypothetical protein IFM89_026495 [Coptis chinensis]|uniref:Uncharacterized protein n=1 Tax=Coptis chinensis TaxID=261450 RepID=A0A835IBF2_9MAGN|nr:hypothetical protein IFM89_026495 [Coptis chinensis]